MDVIFNLEQINQTAKQFLQLTAGSRIFAFNGDMGAGKTTFIHALCEELGVTDAVSSPTYSIINQYRSAGGETIYHMDLYRLKDEDEALNAGVEDSLYSGYYCFVEWPERAPGIFPTRTLPVKLSIGENNTRKIEW